MRAQFALLLTLMGMLMTVQAFSCPPAWPVGPGPKGVCQGECYDDPSTCTKKTCKVKKFGRKRCWKCIPEAVNLKGEKCCINALDCDKQTSNDCFRFECLPSTRSPGWRTCQKAQKMMNPGGKQCCDPSYNSCDDDYYCDPVLFECKPRP